MNVRVLLFAVARQLVGRDFVELDLPASTTVGELRTALVNQCGALKPILGQVRFAVNKEYAADGRTLSPGDEVACIPPVSGG